MMMCFQMHPIRMRMNSNNWKVVPLKFANSEFVWSASLFYTLDVSRRIQIFEVWVGTKSLDVILLSNMTTLQTNWLTWRPNIQVKYLKKLNETADDRYNILKQSNGLLPEKIGMLEVKNQNNTEKQVNNTKLPDIPSTSTFKAFTSTTITNSIHHR